MTTQIIRADDVRKSYGRGHTRFDALKGVTFTIAEGESVAILGKSGSGKSTLMHILALLDAPSTGRIALENLDTRALKGRHLNRTRNKTFGFVFQQFFLIPSATVLDNVTLPLKIAGVSQTGAVVEDILFDLNREHGITLIVVTHDEELAARCDRQLRIRDGLLVDDSTGAAA